MITITFPKPLKIAKPRQLQKVIKDDEYVGSFYVDSHNKSYMQVLNNVQLSYLFHQSWHGSREIELLDISENKPILNKILKRHKGSKFTCQS